MKHYKIEKKTLYGISYSGELTEESTYQCYVKVLWWWKRMKVYDMFDNGLIHDRKHGYRHIEDADKFIHNYHKHLNKIGKYDITTVETIDLK